MARVIDHTFKKSGAWFGESGRNVYEWSTATERQYDHSRLRVTGGTASIRTEPAEGTVGHLELVVDWRYDWFGKVEYNLRAYDAPLPSAGQGLSLTRSSHLRKRNGSWFGANGEDKIPFKIPADFTVREVSINVLAGSAEITNHDALIGMTGSIVVDVSWRYGWFGHSGYYVTVLLVNSNLSLAISAETVTPDPGIVGEEIQISYTITNDGGVQIDRVSEIIEIYAIHLEDLDDLILNRLSYEERTSEFGGEEIVLNLPPGGNIVRHRNLVIPEYVSEENHISSAGTYNVTLRMTVGGITLVESAISSLRIVKP
jgi:hypothetical protein